MALLKYTLLRLALLAVTAGVLYLVGLREWVLLFVAFLVSGIISIFALNRARDDVSSSLTQRQQAINERIEAQRVDDGPAEGSVDGPVEGSEGSADGSADDQPDAQPDR
jgi:membrane protein implicated in regulation of membrane protease activity